MQGNGFGINAFPLLAIGAIRRLELIDGPAAPGAAES
jgi:hypothetical protein